MPFASQAEALPEPRRTVALQQIARAEGRAGPPMSPERLALLRQEKQFAEAVSYLLGVERHLLGGLDAEIARARERLAESRCPVAARQKTVLGDIVRSLRDWADERLDDPRPTRLPSARPAMPPRGPPRPRRTEAADTRRAHQHRRR